MEPSLLRFLLLTLAGWVNRHQHDAIAYLKAENRMLRDHLGSKRLLLDDGQRRRLAIAGHRLGRARLRELESVFSPETILRWYRQLVARKYDGSMKRRATGRPRTRTDIATLVLRMADDNPTWGYTRIRGALANLGHEIARSTIANILAEHGREPSPHRGMSWAVFLKSHFGQLAAADFFTVEILTLVGLVRHHVFFVIHLETRAVEIAGVVAEPYTDWLKQILRNLTDPLDGFLLGKTRSIVDRGSVFNADFRRALAHEGIEMLQLPARSPNLNAYAERFVRSIRRECLDHIVPLGARHLMRVLGEYERHYNHERNHQGLGNRLIRPECATNGDGPIQRQTRLGGLLSYYCREAA